MNVADIAAELDAPVWIEGPGGSEPVDAVQAPRRPDCWQTPVRAFARAGANA